MDDKQHCCSVQTSSRETLYLSLESRSELLQLEKAWYRTNHGAVTRLKVRGSSFLSYAMFILINFSLIVKIKAILVMKITLESFPGNNQFS